MAVATQEYDKGQGDTWFSQSGIAFSFCVIHFISPLGKRKSHIFEI
jgi:hypothetical protein